MSDADPELMIGSFIYDEAHRTTGVVEEFRDGLVRYSVRTALGSSRDRAHWTPEGCCYVLLEEAPKVDAHERLLNDLFAGLGCFVRGEFGNVYWEDVDGRQHRVRLEIDD